MTKLVMGHIVCIGPDDEEAIPYDEAVIHIEGDEDSEIRINCPGALRLAPKIVEAVNAHDMLVKTLEGIAEYCSGDDRTLGALHRLTSIRNTAINMLAHVSGAKQP